MTSTTEANKAVVRRFNKDVIEQGRMEVLAELVADSFINHTAGPGMSKGPDGMASFFTQILHPAFADLEVQIHDMIAEGDKVVTRKSIVGTHRGPFLGVQATGRRIEIKITDIVRVVDGKYVEHWGSADMFGAHAQLTKPD